jgi:phage gp36-like protein
VIVSQPASRTNLAGTTATFTVIASGTTPFSYQWLKDGTILVDGGNVSGANTATLTLVNVQPADAGHFAVVVTNRSGRVNSSATALVVFADTDGDGVLDGQDECPDTAQGAVVDEYGCSIAQYVPCAGPATGGTWRNHGQYLRALRAAADAFMEVGLITADERDTVLRAGGHSECGK